MVSWTRYAIVAAVAMACAMGPSTSRAAECQLWAWGDNTRGQLGNETRSDTPVSIPVLITDGVTAVAAGSAFTIVVKNNEVWTCGDNSARQLGYQTPSDDDYSATLQRVVIPGVLIHSVAAGSKSSFAIRDDGSWWAWGNNPGGLLGLGHTGNPVISPEQQTSYDPFIGVKTIVAGVSHCLALTDAGEVWSWGNNGDYGGSRNYGQLGRELSNIEIPGPVTGLDAGVTAIAAGDHHGLALTNAGKVWSWGRNDRDQLGRATDDDLSEQSTPSLVTGLIGTVTAIAAGGNENLAVIDGHVWGWGENSQAPHELFDRTAFPELAKIQTVAIGFWNETESGTLHYYYSYFALTDSGDLYAWGDNSYGQLGLGTIGTKADPSLIPEWVGSDFTSISTNGRYVLALRGDIILSTPEPGSLGMLTLGVAYLLQRRRKL